MNRYKKLFSDTLILGLGTFGSKLIVFLLMPLYTALLWTSEYGAAELINSVANLLIPLACVGITNGIFRFAAERGSDKAEVFSSSVALLGIGLSGFLLLSPLLGFVGYLSGYGWLIAAYVFFADVQAVCASYIRAIDRPKLFAVQGILNTFLTVSFNILFLVAFDMGVTGYVLSVVVGNLLTTVFMIWQARLWQVFRPSKIRREVMRELLHFSLPLIPTTVCWLITDLSDRYMVTAFCGSAANGIYSAAYKIPTVVNLVSAIFMQAWQFSAVAESSDEDACRSFYSGVFDGFLSLIFIGSAGLVLLSELLTRILLNSAYYGAWEYMPTLLCAVALEALVSFLATVYMVRKKSMHSFLTAVLGTVVNVVLNLLLIPSMGALGAAIATLAAYGTVLVARLIDVPRILPFRLHLRRMVLNAMLLFGASALMTASVKGKYLWVILITLLVIAVNAPPLLKSLRHLLQRRSGKEM
jgi:O-antigen/teichoic acid export membrane protein